MFEVFQAPYFIFVLFLCVYLVGLHFFLIDCCINYCVYNKINLQSQTASTAPSFFCCCCCYICLFPSLLALFSLFVDCLQCALYSNRPANLFTNRCNEYPPFGGSSWCSVLLAAADAAGLTTGVHLLASYRRCIFSVYICVVYLAYSLCS